MNKKSFLGFKLTIGSNKQWQKNGTIVSTVPPANMLRFMRRKSHETANF